MLNLKSYFLFISLVITLNSEAQIRLPQLMSDGAVLQREVPLKIWGWASPKEKLQLTLEGKKYKTQADAQGNWSILLPAHAAGGPFEFYFKAKNEVALKNILYGDVWLCTGQSNMVHQLQHHDVTYAKDIQNANNPQIRQFLVPTLTQLNGPAIDYQKQISWKEANPSNVREFSAVAYFFALKVFEVQKAPIGLINASVGGTPIEAWTSEEGFKDFKDVLRQIAKNKDSTYVNSFNRPRANFVQRESIDKGLTEKWFENSYKPINWKNINIPGYWEDQGIKDLNGVVWYRREIEIPNAMIGKEVKVWLGRIVDADEFYVNGQKIGNTTYMYPQRRYSIPAGVLRNGKNLLTIKVTNNAGKGGFVPDKPYALFTDKDTIDLKGTWQYKVGEVFVPRQGFGGGGFSAQNQPTALFNAMTAPATHFPIKGVLWYQGESNTGQAEEYESLQIAQIADYRRLWNSPNLPFLFVQLPGFMDATYVPTESNWARFRESQRRALTVTNTGMAVAIDLGEWNDIHPDNKKDVGERLALTARKVAYNESIVSTGPMFESLRKEGNKLIVKFSHTGSGLISDDTEPLREFALAGTDRKFLWAESRIVGDEIELWSKDLSEPLYVRYAWADNPDVNLYNKEGLPASPFEASLENKSQSQLWNGKKAAIVLTYDDALEVHLDKAIPSLDASGFKGTFYLSAAFPGSKNRIEDWKRIARRGHELGNHTIYHPCDASKPGRSWVSKANDLHQYTTEEIVREVEMTNTFLKALDGKSERTFAYTCGDTETGEGSFIDAIKDQFIALRGVKSELNYQEKIDLLNVNCYVIDNSNAHQLPEWAEKAKKENALMVVLFHGVGGGHNIDTDLDKHNAFVKYLKDHENDFWVTTMLDAAKNSLEVKSKKN